MTRFTALFTAGMHRSEHRNRKVPCAPPFHSPVAGFLQLPDQCFQARRSLLTSRGRMLTTTFRSPATDSACTVSIPGSTFLACRFASSPAASAARSASRSIPDARIAPVADDFFARDPLPLPRPAWLAASPASTPHRDSCIPLDQSVLPVRLPADPPFRTRPIPVRSPLPFSITSKGCGSTFPSRYVSGGLLFLKPLGTSSTMLPSLDFVKSFVIESSLFPQFLFTVF